MDYLEGIVTTVGHISWPATAIIIAIISRKELRNIFASLAKRIGDKDSEVSLTKEGLKIKSIEARLVSFQVDQDQFKSLALRHLNPMRLPKADALAGIETIDNYTHLKKMADEYLNINIPDYSERIKAKDTAAEEMAFYVVSNKINKDQLAQEKHEGLLIALARSIVLSPEIGDAERLLKAAYGAKRLHVRYQVLIAIVNLIERNLFPLSDLKEMRELLSDYEKGADSSLNHLILNVKSLVQ